MVPNQQALRALAAGLLQSFEPEATDFGDVPYEPLETIKVAVLLLLVADIVDCRQWLSEIANQQTRIADTLESWSAYPPWPHER